MKPITWVISCEHAVNFIPSDYQHHFNDNQELLNTHLGIDFGALAIAERLSQSLNCQLVTASVSRLLIDCNRSPSHPKRFSTISNHFSQEEKNHLVQHYYLPFRQDVESSIQKHLSLGHQVWHWSIHSFTPILHGIQRNAEIGLLYDPKRNTEKIIARTYQQLLKQYDKNLRIRLNYPYRGVGDGFTTHLRKKFSQEDYIGLELENNQALTCDPSSLNLLLSALENTCQRLKEQFK